MGLVVRGVVNAAMSTAAKLAGNRLTERNSEALAKQDYMAAALTGFKLDLKRGEEERILLRSQR